MLTVLAAVVTDLQAASVDFARESRIVNGHTIRRGEWPFLVSMHYLKDFPFTQQTHMKHLCGGALVHPLWVVTAGHCVGFFEELGRVENWNVVVGEHNQYLTDSGEQLIRPEKFFVFPDFKPHATNNLKHDIALVKLSRPANLSTPYVDVIDLNQVARVPDSTKCQVGGWGQVSSEPYGWGMYIPLKTSLFIINNETCKQIYDNLEYQVGDIRMVTDDSVVCAGIPMPEQTEFLKQEEGNNDACNGDSGSPLICPTGPDGEYQVAGVVSAGKGCGTGRYPGIYTRISHYIIWLNDVMANN